MANYIGIILTSISIIVFFFLIQTSDLEKYKIVAISIGLTFLGILVQNVAMNLSTDDRLKEIERGIQRYMMGLRLAIEGRANSAATTHLSQIPKAKHVRNTFVGLVENRGDREIGKTVVGPLYEAWLKNGMDGEWQDICGPDEESDARFTSLHFGGTLTGAHNLFVLKEKMPFMNFIIFEYPDETREVLFGWMPDLDSLTDREIHIFGSKDSRIVALFELHFHRLREGCRNATSPIAISHAIPEQPTTGLTANRDK